MNILKHKTVCLRTFESMRLAMRSTMCTMCVMGNKWTGGWWKVRVGVRCARARTSHNRGYWGVLRWSSVGISMVAWQVDRCKGDRRLAALYVNQWVLSFSTWYCPVWSWQILFYSTDQAIKLLCDTGHPQDMPVAFNTLTPPTACVGKSSKLLVSSPFNQSPFQAHYCNN